MDGQCKGRVAPEGWSSRGEPLPFASPPLEFGGHPVHPHACIAGGFLSEELDFLGDKPGQLDMISELAKTH